MSFRGMQCHECKRTWEQLCFSLAYDPLVLGHASVSRCVCEQDARLAEEAAAADRFREESAGQEQRIAALQKVRCTGAAPAQLLCSAGTQLPCCVFCCCICMAAWECLSCGAFSKVLLCAQPSSKDSATAPCELRVSPQNRLQAMSQAESSLEGLTALLTAKDAELAEALADKTELQVRMLCM